MALHTQLPIYRAAYGLLDRVTDLVKNMSRDFKRSIGEKISAECIEIIVLVYRANVATDKSPHLTELIERQQLFRPAAPGDSQSPRSRAACERRAGSRACG